MSVATIAGKVRCQIVWLILCVSILGVDSQVSAQIVPDAAREAYEALKNDREAAARDRARAEQQRYKLLDVALRERLKQQEKAGQEREQRLEGAIRRLKAVIEARQAVVRTLPDQKEDLSAQLKDMHRRFQRLARNRNQWTQKFAHFPEESQGAIRSGRALNHFLRLNGQAIARQEFLLANLTEERKRYQEILATSDGSKAKDAEQQIARLDEQLRLLKSVGGERKIPPHHFDHINLKAATGDSAPIYNLGRGVLAINWRIVHALPEGEFKAHETTIELCKDAALKELADAGGVSVATSEELRKATEDLLNEFSAYRVAFSKKDEFLQYRNGMNINLLYQAKNMLEQLRIDVAGLVTAMSIYDVVIAPDFAGDTVHELVIYMVRNGLTFGEAHSVHSRAAYQAIFEELARHHVDSRTLVASLQSDEAKLEKELASLLERDKELMKIQFEDPVARAVDAMNSRPAPSVGEVVLTGLKIWGRYEAAMKDRQERKANEQKAKGG